MSIRISVIFQDRPQPYNSILGESEICNVTKYWSVLEELHCATKFGSCLVLGVLTAGLYLLVIKTTETDFFSAVKIRLGSGEFFL